MKYTYEKPEYLDVNGARHLVQELKKYIQDIMNGKIDISQYATKDELSSAVSSIDLSGYALKGEIPSLDGYAKTTDIPSVEGLATKTYVDESIANVATSGDIDLSNYVTKDTVYTKEQTDALIPSVPSKVSELENDSNYLSSIPGEYVTDTELNAKGYLTEHQDLSAYALKTEIPTVPSLDGYATTEYVNNAVSNIPTTDLSNYYTKNETYSKTEVDTLVANSGGGTTEPTTPTPTPTPTVTMQFYNPSSSVKCGYNRKFTVKYYDADGTEVSSNYDTVFSISDADFDTSLITLTDGGNVVTVRYDDYDIIGKTFTLNAVDSNSTLAPISTSVELIMG